MYFVCPRYVLARMSKMSARESLQLPVCGVWCFLYSWSTCLSCWGDRCQWSEVSLCLGMLDSLSSLTGELNSPLIFGWARDFYFGSFSPEKPLFLAVFLFSWLYFHSLSALLKKLNYFFLKYLSNFAQILAAV